MQFQLPDRLSIRVIVANAKNTHIRTRNLASQTCFAQQISDCTDNAKRPSRNMNEMLAMPRALSEQTVELRIGIILTRKEVSFSAIPPQIL